MKHEIVKPEIVRLKVDKGIPIPKMTLPANARFDYSVFDRMNVGDSFVVEWNVRNYYRQRASRYNEGMLGVTNGKRMNFLSRTVYDKDGNKSVRIWRKS